MTRTSHANKCAKVYEVENELRGEGFFAFRRTSPHGLFHIVAMKKGKMSMYQVARLHKFTEGSFNKEMSKVIEFVQSDVAPRDTKFFVFFWVNHRGWMKYEVHRDGHYDLIEDFGYNHFRRKNNMERNSSKDLKRARGY